mgnify:CR=1 FL=1
MLNSRHSTNRDTPMTQEKLDLPADFNQVVCDLRTKAQLKQAQLAKKLGIDASKVSRLETGDFSPARSEISAYLQAIGTVESIEYDEYLSEEWNELPRPPFWHPERKVLRQAELRLQQIGEFLDNPSVPGPLVGKAQHYAMSLHRAAAYLMSRAHDVAYIGEIGVGKTTFICSQTGLILPGEKQTGLHQIVLETGQGGTTVCEVRLHESNHFSISVEPEDDSSVYDLVTEFCAAFSVEQATTGDEEPQEKGVSREVDRAIRNMTGLQRTTKKGDDGKRIRIDPARDLAKEFPSLNDFRTAVSERLGLWKRTRREISADTTSAPDGLKWLKQTFAKINNGQHPDFSLPRRIDVYVPSGYFIKSPYELEIVDTKGVDKNAIRPDLQACVDDPRTVTVLCSKFAAAPGVSLEALLRHLVQTGGETALKERAVLLVLPHPGEALGMKDDSGEMAESDEEGYEFKRDQIDHALGQMGVQDLQVCFANVTMGEAPPVTGEILDTIQRMRRARQRRIESLAEAVADMIENQEKEHALEAQNEVNKRLQIFIMQNKTLSRRRRPIQQELIKAAKSLHPRTVWATLSRNGTWDNFDVFFYLGSGAVADAKIRASSAVNGLLAIVDNALADEDLAPAHSFLKELKEDIPLLASDFLETVRRSGELSFRSSLGDDDRFWGECESIYGQGRAFRKEVAELLEEWFEDADRQDLHEAFEERVQKAWAEEFLNPIEATGSETLEEVEEAEDSVAA